MTLSLTTIPINLDYGQVSLHRNVTYRVPSKLMLRTSVSSDFFHCRASPGLPYGSRSAWIRKDLSPHISLAFFSISLKVQVTLFPTSCCPYSVKAFYLARPLNNRKGNIFRRKHFTPLMRDCFIKKQSTSYRLDLPYIFFEIALPSVA